MYLKIRMEWLWSRVTQAPCTVLLLSACVSAVFAWGALTRLRVDTSVDALMAGDDASTQVLDRLTASFGEDSALQILVEGDVYSRAYLQRLRALHRAIETTRVEEVEAALEAAEGGRAGDASDSADAWGGFEGATTPSIESAPARWIDQLQSLVNARTTDASGGALSVHPLLPPEPSAADIAGLRAALARDRTLQEVLVDAPGRHSLLVVRPVSLSPAQLRQVYTAVEEHVRAADAPGFRTFIAGLPALEVNMERATVSDTITLVATAQLVMCVMLWWLFRKPLGVLGPLLVLVQSSIWTLGAMAFSGTPLTVIGGVLPGFLSAVGVADSVHLQSAYVKARREGVETRAALRQALRETAIPIVFTTLTTAAGLLSLGVSVLDSVRGLGIFAAFGVLAALWLTLSFLPAFLCFDRGPAWTAERKRSDVVDRILGLFARGAAVPLTEDAAVTRTLAAPARVGRRAGWVLGATALLVLVSCVGLSRIEVGQHVLQWMPEGHDPRAAYAHMDEHMGGAGSMALLMHAGPGRTFRDRDVLQRVEVVEAALQAHPRTGTILGLPRVVPQVWRSLHGDDPHMAHLPETEQGVRDALQLFESAARDDLRRILTPDARTTWLYVRSQWTHPSDLLTYLTGIQRAAEEALAGFATVEVTGSVVTQFRTMDRVVNELVTSLGIALVVILLLVSMMMGSVRLGLVAMLPNLVPILAMLGFMGFTGMYLDGSSVLVASISLGIVVDDTIHFFHTFRKRYAVHADVERALRETLSGVGRAVITTTLVLTAGFAVFLFAGMKNIQAFGTLTAVAVLTALVMDLLVVPVALRAAYGKGALAPAADGAAWRADGPQGA